MKAISRYLFYPITDQKRSLAQLFNCVLVVWNDALAECYENKILDYSKLYLALTERTKLSDRAWFNEVSSVPLQQSLKHLSQDFKNYFDSRSSKRKRQLVGLPKFKKRCNRQGVTFVGNSFSLKGPSVSLAKIGIVKPIWSRQLTSKPSSVTVIKDCALRYFLSFVF